MFSNSGTGKSEVLIQKATTLMKAYEQLLAFRISLQKPLDIVSNFPLVDSITNNEIIEKEELTESINSLLKHLLNILNSAAGINGVKLKKRKKEEKHDIILWESLINPQNILQEKWSSVLNKWHARINFGSTQTMKKLKVFNNSFWDQVYLKSSLELQFCPKFMNMVYTYFRLKILYLMKQE